MLPEIKPWGPRPTMTGWSTQIVAKPVLPSTPLQLGRVVDQRPSSFIAPYTCRRAVCRCYGVSGEGMAPSALFNGYRRSSPHVATTLSF
jgi:hypothetical protein